MVLIALIMLISMASGVQVNEVAGPFNVAFELPVDKVSTDIPAPYPGATLTLYGLTTSADKWFINIVITKFDDRQEIDVDADRRGVAALAGVDKTQAANRVIDGKSAVYAAKESNNGTTLDAIYWLDDTTYAEITIGSNEPADTTEKVLDTLKITQSR
jgi:hypothetical protein